MEPLETGALPRSPSQAIVTVRAALDNTIVWVAPLKPIGDVRRQIQEVASARLYIAWFPTRGYQAPTSIDKP